MRNLAVLAAALAFAPVAANALPADTFIFGSSDYIINVPTLTINGTTTLNATDAGWYDVFGSYDTANANYIAGIAGGNNHNDFFVFDLSGISGPITSASLNVFNSGFSSDGGATSAFYNNYDVSTGTGTLTSLNAGRTDITADLASGNAYASTLVSSSDPSDTTMNIALDAQALADITAAEGRSFAIGGTLADNAAAIANTPLPASFWMFAAGLLGMFGLSRTRRAA